ncbi:protein Btn1p [Monosporozyma unispora]|nr:battenin CLN3 protein [Kazachstania unispora]
MRLYQNYYLIFWLFGLINNVLYVVILSAAMDLVGPQTPKSLILLFDILPSLLVKLISPFHSHRIKYNIRVISIIMMSVIGMICVSSHYSLGWTLLGVTLASISSGFGEVTFLQLTHFHNDTNNGDALNGWSSGTGGAGLVGSFCYLLLTSFFNLPISLSLLLFAFLPLGFLMFFRLDLKYQSHIQLPDSTMTLVEHNTSTWSKLKPLIFPYMFPLTTVYLFEYLINQSVAPTLLFPLELLPFKKFRDLYVLYGTLYQIGVFISRSSGKWIRLRHLYLLSLLQAINFILTILQSWYFINKKWPWLNMILVLWEGLLGGFSYVNTFLNIQHELSNDQIEFAMGSVSIADSLGVFLAALIGLSLEPTLCNHQINNGRPWCRME